MTTTQQKTVQRSAAKHAPAPGGGLSSVPIGRSMGNGALSDYLFSHYKVSDPADPAEVAAERTADRVMAGGQAQAEAPAGGGAEISRSPEDGESAPSGGADASSGSGGATDLPGAVREKMEGAFGRSFGGVKMHHDERADALSRGFHAKAFTKDGEVYFRRGAYDPGSRVGQRLIAHELAHVDADKGRIMRAKPKGSPGTKPKGQTQGRKRKDSLRRKPKETDEEMHVPIEFSGPSPNDPDYVETDWRHHQEVNTDTQDPPPAPETPASELAAPAPQVVDDPEVVRQKAIVEGVMAAPTFERFASAVGQEPELLRRAADAKPEVVETEEAAAKAAAKGTTGLGGSIQKAATKSDSDSTVTNISDVTGAALTELGTDYTAATVKLPGVSDEALGNHKIGGKSVLAAGQALTTFADARKWHENKKKMNAVGDLTDAERDGRTRTIDRAREFARRAVVESEGKPWKPRAEAVQTVCDNMEAGSLAGAGGAREAARDFIKENEKTPAAVRSVESMRMAENNLTRLSMWHGGKAQKKEELKLAKNLSLGNAFSHGTSAIGAIFEAVGSSTAFSKAFQTGFTVAGRVLSAVGGIVSSIAGAMGTVNKAKLAAQKKKQAKEVNAYARRTLLNAYAKVGDMKAGEFNKTAYRNLRCTAINKPAIEKWVPAAEAFTDLTDSDVDMGRFLQGCEDGDPDEIKAAAMTGLGFEG